MLTQNTIESNKNYKNTRDNHVFIGTQLANICAVRQLEDGPVVLFLVHFVETSEPATLPDSEFGLEEE